MEFQEEIKRQQEIRKANIFGQFKEPDLFFKATSEEEFLCINLDIEKAKKIVVGYEHGGYVVTGFYENGQPKWKSKKKHLKEQTGGTEKTDNTTNKIADFAKNASEDDLRRAIKEHGDEAVRTAAHDELKRREQEESTANHPDTKEVEEKLNPTEDKPKPKKKGDNHSGTYNTQAPGFDKEKGDVDVTGTKGEKIPKSKLSPEAQI